MTPDPPGAVLLLAHVRDRGVLTAARALQRAGWRVGAGSPRPDGGLLGASRAVDRVHVVPRPRGDGQDFLGAVRDAHREGGYQLVLGSGDDWMAAVAHYREHLPMPTGHPVAEVVRRATDKVVLARTAQAVGLGSVRTEPVTEQDLPGWPVPVVVKNRSHWSPGQQRRHRIETRVCRTPEELRTQVDRVRSGGDQPVLQEYVEGHLSALIGLMHEGRLVGRVQQVSPRLWPTPSGASSRARTVPVDRGLAARCEQLLTELGWSGLVELQFLVDGEGVHRVIDLNGRFFGSLALSEGARPGLVDAWARAALGLPVPALADGTVGLRYHWMPGDLRRAVAERRRGLPRDLWDSLRWGVGARHSVASAGDPGPAWRLLTGRLVPDRGDAQAAPTG